MARKSKRKSKKTIELKAKRSSRRATVDEGGRSGRRAGGSSRRASAGSSRRSGKRRAIPTGGLPAKVAVTCRECSYPFNLDVPRAKNHETITCPVCEHRAQAPSDDLLHQIALYGRIERKNLIAAVAALALGVFSILFWTLLTISGVAAQDPLVFHGPIGLAVVCLLAALFFGASYERSRWSTFF